MARPRVWGLVLAGGQSRRFPGGAKALQSLNDTPMVLHVLRRLSPQVNQTWLSTGPSTGPDAALDALEEARGLRRLPDDVPRFRGPLAGLAKGLEALAENRREDASVPAWLQLAPCDAPFLPLDLVQRLFEDEEPAEAEVTRVRVPSLDGQLQPTFSAWHVEALPDVARAIEQRGGAGLMHVLRGLPHTVVPWPSATPDPFFNVNTPQDLERAAHWLQSQAV